MPTQLDITENKIMKAEDLMKPRYKVIAGYPDTPFTVGEILLLHKWRKEEYECKWFDENEDTNYASESKLILYPHLFKKLEWWEERAKGDMPKYVKYNAELGAGVKSGIGDVVKVHKWWQPGNGGISYESGGGTLADYLLPATEEEYNQNK